MVLPLVYTGAFTGSVILLLRQPGEGCIQEGCQSISLYRMLGPLKENKKKIKPSLYAIYFLIL
jgi:hypothetical protein